MNPIHEFTETFGEKGVKFIAQTAWAAGLFEGEGSFTIHKCRNPTKANGWTNINVYPTASISMTDKDVLERFAKIIGMGKVNGPYKTKGREDKKDKYIWMVVNKQAMKVVELFKPFLLERRKIQIDNMLSRCGRFQSNNPKDFRGSANE